MKPNNKTNIKIWKYMVTSAKLINLDDFEIAVEQIKKLEIAANNNRLSINLIFLESL